MIPLLYILAWLAVLVAYGPVAALALTIASLVVGFVALGIAVWRLEPDADWTVDEPPSELSMRMRAFEADVAGTMAEIGRRLAPVLRLAATELRAFFEAWPGMPYTAPSLWDASQMAADGRRR